MKTIQKVLAILIIAVCTLGIMPTSNVLAAGSGDKASTIVDGVEGKISRDGIAAGGLQDTVGQLLGFLQIASGLVAIVMIAIVGFNYIVSTPDVKEEMKKKMLPIIIGLVLVFGAVSIAKFILGAVGG